MSNGKILMEAYELLNGLRQREYGPPVECLDRTASLWSSYLSRHVTAKDVGICMVLLKIARESYAHNPDNILDACGYLALAADMVGSSLSDAEVVREDLLTTDSEEGLPAGEALSLALASVSCGEPVRAAGILKGAGFSDAAAACVLDGMLDLVMARREQGAKKEGPEDAA